jgi:hypothetical protein
MLSGHAWIVKTGPRDAVERRLDMVSLDPPPPQGLRAFSGPFFGLFLVDPATFLTMTLVS